ncbi:hypothetical protein BJY21_004175 [Kineosphaera limosa]|nr:hypothetical protein [Kineosphaera limosa]
MTTQPNRTEAGHASATTSPSAATRVRVVIATPLRPELVQRIVAVDPRVEVVVDHDLLPPMRCPADHAGDPSFRRTPEQQQRFEKMLAAADVIYGIPGVDPAQIAPTVRANPGLKWLTTMAAGGGAAVAAAGLTPEELERVTFTTSAGVHGVPLAEWALFGIMAGAKELPRLLADQAAHHWPERVVSRPIEGSTVLVLGLGGIGEQVARLSRALGCSARAARRPRSRACRCTRSPTCPTSSGRPTTSSSPCPAPHRPKACSATNCSPASSPESPSSTSDAARSSTSRP